MNPHQANFIYNQPSMVKRLMPAVVIGDFKVMYRPGQAFERTRTKLARQGLHIEMTPHFLFAHTPTTPSITLVHQFSEEQIDNNIVQYLMQELSPYGFLKNEKAFGAALVGVVNSIKPQDPASAWGLFSLNTLQRLRERIGNVSDDIQEQDNITPFAKIYQHLFSHRMGSSLLDVGCACAFWPLLVAEREQSKQGDIVGVDNRRDAITLSANMAALANITNVYFVQRDLLADDFIELGVFDTVTAIHLLEHLPESLLPHAFSHLLQVTRHCLLVAVPYEEQAEIAYGHVQVFSRQKLEQWGKWCVEQLGGKGRAYCEDAMGGLLVIERA